MHQGQVEGLHLWQTPSLTDFPSHILTSLAIFAFAVRAAIPGKMVLPEAVKATATTP